MAWARAAVSASTASAHSSVHHLRESTFMAQSFRRRRRLLAVERLRLQHRNREAVIDEIPGCHLLHLYGSHFAQLADLQVERLVRIPLRFQLADLARLDDHRVALEYLRGDHLRLHPIELRLG